MRALFILIILSFACLASANDVMSEFEAYKKQQQQEFKRSIFYGSYYSEPAPQKPIPTVSTPKTQGINSFEAYKKAFDENIARLHERFTIVASRGFNPEPYIEKVADLEEGLYNAYYIQIERKRGIYSISYSITYNDDYKILKTLQEPALKSKLSNKDITLYNEVAKLLPRLINKNMNDFDKVLAIHDHLVANVTYDQRVVSNYKANLNAFEAYGAIVENTAVCDGYAKAMNLLINMAGVKAIKLSGTANGVPHAWNRVVLGGNWYNIDATFDDPLGTPKNMVYYDYFNIADSVLAKNHIWDLERYPVATATAYNYFVYNGLVADSHSKFVELITKATKASPKKYVSVYLTNYDTQSYSMSFLQNLGIKNPRFSVPSGKSGVFTLMYE